MPHAVATVVGAAHGERSTKAAKVNSAGYASRAEVRQFIAEIADAEGFDRGELSRWFAAARYQPKIVELMQRPLLEPPKWFEYSPPFLAPARIAAGRAFLDAHLATLTRAESELGVPAEIVVAIIGVETYFGRYMGSHRVIDALSTLAFDYPRRATFFRGELKEFLLLTREQRVSPLALKGSFAGAMGMPQFMPGSFRRYAVDFDADGRIDLWSNVDDAIGSVANYLARHDWQQGQPILLPATIAADDRDAVLRRLDGGISERRPLSAWNADGVTTAAVPADLAPDPVGLLLLEEDANQASYWIACPNFYVITRYNKSRLYAAAVWSLAQAIRDSRPAR